MKALQMLDHVMLWVARVFAAYAVFFALINLGDRIDRMIIFGSFFIISISWLVCTWTLSHRWAHRLLGITSTLIALIFGALLLQTAHNMDNSDLTVLILPFVGLVGSSTLLWIACRPPKNHPHPQSC
jgi:hypothetical protein